MIKVELNTLRGHFGAVRNSLRKTVPDTEGKVREELKYECPLLDAGWQMETFRTLLELEFEPDFKPPKPYDKQAFCDNCNDIVDHDVKV